MWGFYYRRNGTVKCMQKKYVGFLLSQKWDCKMYAKKMQGLKCSESLGHGTRWGLVINLTSGPNTPYDLLLNSLKLSL